MIIQERNTSIAFSVQPLSSLKNHDWEKNYTRLDSSGENSMQQVLIHFRRSMGSIKIFSWYKKFRVI